MIYTVTLNPSLDYVMDLEHFAEKAINRSFQELILPGGKGINVSQVLRELEMETTAVYFAAGRTGSFLAGLLEERQIPTKVITLPAGSTRINVKLRVAGEETAINASGPAVTDEALQAFVAFLERLLPGDVLVLSGNVPKPLSDNIYADLATRVLKAGASFVVDATGEALMAALPQGPLFAKPNHEELAEILGREVRSPEEALEGARLLQRQGARSVLVSMGAKGAMLLWHTGEAYYAPNPEGQCRNTVGAGDSMVAGFLTGILRGSSPEDALALGIAAGSATAFSDELAKRAEIFDLLDRIQVRKM